MTDFVCDVAERYRPACEGLDFYAEHEGKRYCILHFPGEKNRATFEKAIHKKLEKRDYNFQGVIFPISFKGLRDLPSDSHDFDGITFDAEAQFHGATFEGPAHFYYTVFEARADFTDVHFKERAEFSALFWQATFKELADFSRAIFEGRADFDSSFEQGALFIDAHFKGSTFFSASFEEKASFHRTTFEKETSFGGTVFKSTAEFRTAIFRDTAWFYGLDTFNVQASAIFTNVRLEKPEESHFNTVRLRPSWFVNMDCRKLDFTTVEWYGVLDRRIGSIQEEIKSLKLRAYDNPHSMLAQACRRLSANMEENREYFLANEFHYWSMDAWRIGSWSFIYEALLKEEARRDIKDREQRDIKFKDLWPPNALHVGALLRKDTWTHIRGRRRFGLVNSLYWALSGYGVRAARAFWALVVIWAAFATLYVLVAPAEFKDFGPGIRYLWQSAVYSMLALARLNPEPKPDEPGLFQFLVGIEGILGPLQIALLALAIRRKVMR